MDDFKEIERREYHKVEPQTLKELHDCQSQSKEEPLLSRTLANGD